MAKNKNTSSGAQKVNLLVGRLALKSKGAPGNGRRAGQPSLAVETHRRWLFLLDQLMRMCWKGRCWFVLRNEPMHYSLGVVGIMVRTEMIG